MKLSLICTGLGLLALSSCSTAYRTGQTPDDVYYSPAREVDEYVVASRTEPRYSGGQDYYEDRFLRMRMMDRMRWSSLDYYYNNPYAFSPYNYYHSWNTPWNSYWAWNNFYNPYCNLYFGGGWGGFGSVAIINTKPTIKPSRALVFNPASYNPPSTNQGYSKYSNVRYYGADAGSRYNNTNRNNNSNTSLGNSLRRVFNNSNSSNAGNNNNTRTNNNNTPTRTYNPSSSSSSSSSGRSSSSSSGGGVSRPIR